MQASELIKRLKRRIDLFGDWNVSFREYGSDIDSDLNISVVYGDIDVEQIIVSNAPDLILE